MESFFSVISRINSVLFLLVLLGVGGALVSSLISSNNWQRRAAVNVADPGSEGGKPIPLQLGNIENIAGADTQMIELSRSEGGGKFSSGAARRVRNVLFIGSGEAQARWLFKTHRNLIVESDQLRESSGAQSGDERPAHALYFEYVPREGGAQNDKDASADTDRSSIALARPDGTGFTIVLTGVDRVLTHQLKDAQQLSVVYQRGAELRHARIALKTMKVESDQLLANLPAAL